MNKTLLQRCEAFISGFEGDELQEGVDELLTDLRSAIGPDICYLVVARWPGVGVQIWRKEAFEDPEHAKEQFDWHVSQHFGEGDPAPAFIRVLKVEVEVEDEG